MKGVRIGSLFSGVGALDLAVLEVLGGSVAWHAETDPGACEVLTARWPAVPNLADAASIDWGAVEPVDVLAAGPPCQPVSQAGLRRAQDDDRWLWPAMERAVRALGPRLVLVENVRGLLVRGGADVLGDLAALGFDAEWALLSASSVGAPHRRERVFIAAWPAAAADPAADPEGVGWPLRPPKGPGPGGPASRRPAAADAGRPAGDPRRDAASGETESGRAHARSGRRGRALAAENRDVDWGVYEPAVRRWERVLGRAAPHPTDDLGRLSHWFVEWLMGLPEGWVCGALPRRPALKALGNAVVPAQGAAALRLLLGRARQGAAA